MAASACCSDRCRDRRVTRRLWLGADGHKIVVYERRDVAMPGLCGGLDRGMLTLGSTRTEGSRLYSAHPRGGGSAVFSRVVGPGSSQRVMLTRTTLQLHCVRVISPGGPVPGHRRVPGTRVREGKLRRPTIANAAGRGLRRTYRRCHYRENSEPEVRRCAMASSADQFPVAISRLSEGEILREPQNTRAIKCFSGSPVGPL